MTPTPQARARTMAIGLDGVAAVTAALTFDTRQLERILDDTDTRDLARTLAGWCAELLTHLAAHDCPDAPISVLRHAGIRYSEDGQAA